MFTDRRWIKALSVLFILNIYFSIDTVNWQFPKTELFQTELCLKLSELDESILKYAFAKKIAKVCVRQVSEFLSFNNTSFIKSYNKRLAIRGLNQEGLYLNLKPKLNDIVLYYITISRSLYS